MALPVSQGGIDYQDGGFSSGQGSYPMTGDLAELAARLRSVVTHNREGTVVYIETFESGMSPWQTTEAGTGAEIIVSNANYRSSGYSCKMTGGSDGAHGAQMFRRFPYPALGRYGLEFSALLDTDLQYLIWMLQLRDGTTEYQFQVTYNPATEELIVREAGGGYTTAATGVVLDTGSGLFHTLKLVADFANGTYLRLIVNETEYDLSDYTAYSFANATNPHILVTITMYSNVGTNAVVYVDDLIVTRNEPARE